MGSALDAARQAMHELFPMTKAMWLAWLADQQKAGAGAAQLCQLCAQAVTDYLSVPLWEQYLRCMSSTYRPCAAIAGWLRVLGCWQACRDSGSSW